jgi:hypothetical protein
LATVPTLEFVAEVGAALEVVEGVVVLAEGFTVVVGFTVEAAPAAAAVSPPKTSFMYWLISRATGCPFT